MRALVSTSPVTKPGILGSWKPFQPISTHTNFRRALCATCVTTATSAKPIARPPTISATPCRSTSPMTSWQVAPKRHPDAGRGRLPPDVVAHDREDATSSQRHADHRVRGRLGSV